MQPVSFKGFFLALYIVYFLDKHILKPIKLTRTVPDDLVFIALP